MSHLNRKDLQFIRLCQAGANTFSSCGKRKYMAILVDAHNHVVGMGYNGGPKGSVHCEDGGCPRLQEDSPSGSNYDNCIAIHAEQNAFLHSNYDAGAVRMYVNGPPCFTCAKLIVNSTVQEVIYIRDESYTQWAEVAKFLTDHGVQLKGFTSGS